MTSYVKLVGYTKFALDGADYRPEDLVVYCARASNPENQMNFLTGPKLLEFMINNKHWSPFEMAHVVMEIHTTRDIARQILRHRSFSFQEFSQRYAVVDTLKGVVREARLQDKVNRQNSLDLDDGEEGRKMNDWWVNSQTSVWDKAVDAYKKAIDAGVAKEVARAVLPEGMTPSRLYMAGSLRSWIHYIQLRMGNGAQKEHAEIARVCRVIILNLFPTLGEVLGNG